MAGPLQRQREPSRNGRTSARVVLSVELDVACCPRGLRTSSDAGHQLLGITLGAFRASRRTSVRVARRVGAKRMVAVERSPSLGSLLGIDLVREGYDALTS